MFVLLSYEHHYSGWMVESDDTFTTREMMQDYIDSIPEDIRDCYRILEVSRWRWFTYRVVYWITDRAQLYVRRLVRWPHGR